MSTRVAVVSILDHRPHNFIPGYSMTTTVGDFLDMNGSKPPKTEMLRELKYCEVCGQNFCRHFELIKDDAGILRKVGAKLCPDCSAVHGPADEMFGEATPEAKLKAEAQSDLRVQYDLERRKYRRRGAPEDSRKSTNRCASRIGTKWAKWREPLMIALKAKGKMTAKEIGAVMKCAGPNALFRARKSGFNLVEAGKVENHGGRGKQPSYYALGETRLIAEV